MAMLEVLLPLSCCRLVHDKKLKTTYIFERELTMAKEDKDKEVKEFMALRKAAFEYQEKQAAAREAKWRKEEA